MESNIAPNTQDPQDPQDTKYTQVTVDVPEDRVAEFHSFFGRFLAGGGSRRADLAFSRTFPFVAFCRLHVRFTALLDRGDLAHESPRQVHFHPREVLFAVFAPERKRELGERTGSQGRGSRRAGVEGRIERPGRGAGSASAIGVDAEACRHARGWRSAATLCFPSCSRSGCATRPLLMLPWYMPQRRSSLASLPHSWSGVGLLAGGGWGLPSR